MSKPIALAVAELEAENQLIKDRESALEFVLAVNKQTIIDLEQQAVQLQARVALLESQLSVNEPFKNLAKAGDSTAITVGISDLEKRNEEAVFDALTAFEKRCPYCSKEQFRVGIRDKIEIDHFVPVSKGGQNLPWNLVPICKSCNRKKKDRLPHEFLETDIFNKVNSYLQSVLQRFLAEGIHSYTSNESLSRLIEKHTAFIRHNSSHEFIKELVHLTSMDKIDLLLVNENKAFGGVGKEYLRELIKGRIGEFEAGVLGSPFQPICDRLSSGSSINIDSKTLLHFLKQSGWIDCGRIKSRDFDTKKHIWCAPELASMSKSNLRRRVEGASI